MDYLTEDAVKQLNCKLRALELISGRGMSVAFPTNISKQDFSEQVGYEKEFFVRKKANIFLLLSIRGLDFLSIPLQFTSHKTTSFSPRAFPGDCYAGYVQLISYAPVHTYFF